MAINDPSKLQIQQTGGTGQPTATNPSGAQAAPKTIWAGMTRAEAEQYNLLDEFNKANANSDDVLTQEEYDAHINEPNNTKAKNKTVTSQSGKRQIVGGVYTVVAGDTLSKIAQDFGINYYQLYNVNKDLIGKNINKLEVGWQLKFTGLGVVPEDNDTTSETSGSSENPAKTESSKTGGLTKEEIKAKILQINQMMAQKGKPKIFAGMTLAQAQQIGGETLAIFNQFCDGKQYISNAKFAEYQKGLYKVEISKAMYEIVGESLDIREIKMLVESSLPMVLDMSGTTNSPTYKKTKELVDDKIGEILTGSSDDIATKSKNLYNELKAACDTDKNSGKGSFNHHKERLERGEFTEFEKSALGLQGKLTPEQIEKYAELAAKAEFILPVIQSLSEAIDNMDDDKIMLLIMNLGSDFIDNPDVKAIIQIYGLSGIVDKVKACVAASHIAKNDDSNLAEMEPAIASLYTSILMQNADAESIGVFAQNHEKDIDFIKNIASAVAGKMADGETKSALERIISTPSPSTGSTPSASASGYTSTQGATAQGSVQSVLEFYQTQDNATNPIASTREASIRFYETKGIKDVSAQQQQTNMSARQIFNEMNIHQQIRYVKSRLDNMQKNQVFEMIANNFAAVPDRFRPFVDNYFRQMPRDERVNITLSGSSKVREFMFNQGYTEMSDVVEYVKKFPGMFEKLPDSLKDGVKEYIKDNIKDAIDPSKQYAAEFEILNKDS